MMATLQAAHIDPYTRTSYIPWRMLLPCTGCGVLTCLSYSRAKLPSRKTSAAWHGILLRLSLASSEPSLQLQWVHASFRVQRYCCFPSLSRKNKESFIKDMCS